MEMCTHQQKRKLISKLSKSWKFLTASIDSCATFLRKGGPPQEAYKPNRLAKVVDHCNVDLGRNCFTLLPSHQFLQKCNNFNLTDYKTVIVEFSGLLIKLFDFQESFDIRYTDILC